MNGMEKLLKTASLRLGMKPDELMSSLEKGDMNGILARMKPADKEKVKSVLEDKDKMQNFLNHPTAAEMMKNMQK